MWQRFLLRNDEINVLLSRETISQHFVLIHTYDVMKLTKITTEVQRCRPVCKDIIVACSRSCHGVRIRAQKCGHSCPFN